MSSNEGIVLQYYSAPPPPPPTHTHRDTDTECLLPGEVYIESWLYSIAIGLFALGSHAVTIMHIWSLRVSLFMLALISFPGDKM